MIEQVLNAIGRYPRWVLSSHARPDGDAIGSVLACAQIVEALGKQAQVLLKDRVPLLYQDLPGAGRIVRASTVEGDFEAAIILECDNLQRTHLSGWDGRFVINIDHHTSGKPFADLNWIDPSACATAEMIYELAQLARVRVTPEMATCLYTAVLTDTGAFCFPGTNHRTFALAEELVRCGADPVCIAQGIYLANPFSKTLLLGAALSNLKREGKLAWMHVTRQDMARSQASEEDCEGLVNYALGNQGVEAAAFFRELERGRWRISLRSKGLVNVAGIAEPFGGGGHECAAGFSASGDFDEVSQTILGMLRCALAQTAIR